MEKIDILIPPPWMQAFSLSVSVSVSDEKALELIADAFEHSFRDRGTAESAEEYICRKGEEYILRIMTEVLMNQVATHAGAQASEKLRQNCTIRARTDHPAPATIGESEMGTDPTAGPEGS